METLEKKISSNTVNPRYLFDQFVVESKYIKTKTQKKQLKQKLYAFYDSLPKVLPEEMIGSWKGNSWKIGMPLDNAIKISQWHGKTFHSPTDVDAIICKFNFLSIVGFMGSILFFPWKIKGKTKKYRIPGTKASLKQMTYRMQSSTSMTYNNLPITDHFRKIDSDTLMGIMDVKGISALEFIFYIQKENN